MLTLDKAKSARIKIEEWNISKDEIVVIVDGANDIKLFDICNLGIAYRAQDHSQGSCNYHPRRKRSYKNHSYH